MLLTWQGVQVRAGDVPDDSLVLSCASHLHLRDKGGVSDNGWGERGTLPRPGPTSQSQAQARPMLPNSEQTSRGTGSTWRTAWTRARWASPAGGARQEPPWIPHRPHPLRTSLCLHPGWQSWPLTLPRLCRQPGPPGSPPLPPELSPDLPAHCLRRDTIEGPGTGPPCRQPAVSPQVSVMGQAPCGRKKTHPRGRKGCAPGSPHSPAPAVVASSPSGSQAFLLPHPQLSSNLENPSWPLREDTCGWGGCWVQDGSTRPHA